MEEREFENLSRYVDGDLRASERDALEDEINRRPDLQSALDDLLRVKAQVRQLARVDEPPQALDALVRPLRWSGRPQLRQSPLIPVAAAAAVVVLSVVLGLEIGRHGGLPEAEHPARKPTVFALKSLPEADESSLVGALEHLMAMPYPEPDMLEPEAMMVVGPLPAPPEFLRHPQALEIGSARWPLAGGPYPVGLEIAISVEGGRLVRCRPVAEGDGSVSTVCAAIAEASFVGIEDGDHRATIVIAR